MKREQLSEIICNIEARHIAEAYHFDPDRRSRSKERIIHMNRKRIITFALAAALVFALGTAAYAVFGHRVQDSVMKAGETETPIQESRSYDPLPVDSDTISLQGFSGSPEYKAALAWAEFKHGYDRDGKILDKVGNDPTPWDEKYGMAYHVYSQEMADKIDAIAAEYGLSLHNGDCILADLTDLYTRFGHFCSQPADGSGYYFDDGTFQCDLDCVGLSLQLRRVMKGVLDTVYLDVGDAEEYEQLEYETACGKTVLLALGDDKALILTDSENSFVTINILEGRDDNVTMQRLQELADVIDFSIL